MSTRRRSRSGRGGGGEFRNNYIPVGRGRGEMGDVRGELRNSRGVREQPSHSSQSNHGVWGSRPPPPRSVLPDAGQNSEVRAREGAVRAKQASFREGKDRSSPQQSSDDPFDIADDPLDSEPAPGASSGSHNKIVGPPAPIPARLMFGHKHVMCSVWVVRELAGLSGCLPCLGTSINELEEVGQEGATPASFLPTVYASHVYTHDVQLHVQSSSTENIANETTANENKFSPAQSSHRSAPYSASTGLAFAPKASAHRQFFKGGDRANKGGSSSSNGGGDRGDSCGRPYSQYQGKGEKVATKGDTNGADRGQRGRTGKGEKAATTGDINGGDRGERTSQYQGKGEKAATKGTQQKGTP